MSHYIVKLTSGELVYGTIDEKETDKKMLVLNNPLIWEEYETEDGRMGSALVRYITGTPENKVPVAISAIVSMVTMGDAFINFYDAAVAVQKITEEAYEERLVHMTQRMVSLVMDYQNRAHADQTGDLVISSNSDITIH